MSQQGIICYLMNQHHECNEPKVLAGSGTTDAVGGVSGML